MALSTLNTYVYVLFSHGPQSVYFCFKFKYPLISYIWPICSLLAYKAVERGFGVCLQGSLGDLICASLFGLGMWVWTQVSWPNGHL